MLIALNEQTCVFCGCFFHASVWGFRRDEWRFFFSFLQIVWASFTLFISYMITKALILQRCGDKACGGGKPTTHLYTHWYDAFVLAAARKMCVYLAFFIIFVKCAFTYTCNWMQLAEESVKQLFFVCVESTQHALEAKCGDIGGKRRCII